MAGIGSIAIEVEAFQAVAAGRPPKHQVSESEQY